MNPHTQRDETSTLRTEPGRSARKEAQRRRDRAAELLRSAERWERGAEAEERTAATLAWLPPVYTTLHDLRMPGSPGNVDHLVVGPTGVFLIDTKVHDGPVRYGNGTLWRGRFPMRRELEALTTEAARLGAVLDAPVVTAACFAEGDLPRRRLVVDGVRILAPGELLPFIADRAATVLPHEVERLVQEASRLARRGQAGVAAVLAGAGTPLPPATAPIAASPPPPSVDADDGAAGRPALLGRALRLGAALALAGVAAYVTGALLTEPASRPPLVSPSATLLGRSTGGTDPVVKASARCPRPGQGWTLGLDWPGLPVGAARYEVSWRSGGTTSWITAGYWASPDQLNPLALNGLPSGTEIEVRLIAQDAAAATVGEWQSTLSMPGAAC